MLFTIYLKNIYFYPYFLKYKILYYLHPFNIITFRFTFFIFQNIFIIKIIKYILINNIFHYLLSNINKSQKLLRVNIINIHPIFYHYINNIFTIYNIDNNI